MPITIRIPSALRPECGGSPELSVSVATVRDALEQLEQSHPALYRSVCEETGAVRRHINLFVNSSLLSRSTWLDAPLEPGDVLSIMTAVSGG
jgi:molybdopterin converting factor small subunit